MDPEDYWEDARCTKSVGSPTRMTGSLVLSS